jgi:predicted HTH domain antitoxin
MNLQVSLPENVNFDETELKIILAGELYEREKLTLGQAAVVAGLSKRTFIEIMGKYGFSVFSDSTDDLMADIANA